MRKRMCFLMLGFVFLGGFVSQSETKEPTPELRDWDFILFSSSQRYQNSFAGEESDKKSVDDNKVLVNAEKSKDECQNRKSKVRPVRYDFEGFEDWRYAHQDTASLEQYRIADGCLFLSTRAGTYDRTKANLVATKMGVGKSSCRLYIPTMYPNDQTSIASFLYSDNRHEIDFEIGYGKAKTRLKYDAGADEVLCYMTSQGYPYQSKIVKLKMNSWVVLDIDLTLNNGQYFVQWFIDGQVKATLQQTFGSEVRFSPILSLENLKFLGDRISKHDYEVPFDWLEITQYKD